MSKTTKPSSAFDAVANRYDADADANPMMGWLRRESLRQLTPYFHAGDTLLEIGCGTGKEAIALARRGIRVVATDASAGMIEVVNRKLQGNDELRGRIITKALPVEQLDSLIGEYGPASFDGAYSSLGPLNCTRDLEAAASALAALVRPGGAVAISMLNKYCLWETAWYLAAGKPGLAFRRWGGRASGTAWAGDVTLDVYYWPVRQIERTFREEGFRVRTRRALPWALPPTYAAGMLRRRPRLFAALNRIERGTARMWPFYAVGDHIYLDILRL